MSDYVQTGNYIALKSVSGFNLHVQPGDTAESLKFFAFALDCTAMLMSHCLSELESLPLTIVYSENLPNPSCQRELRLILLSTRPYSWSQVVYQFAHELCHYAIPGHVSQNLRWIEESICQMSSIYFLHAISRLWKTQGVMYQSTDGKPYYLSFESYATDDAQRAEKFNFTDSSVLQYLESECEDRPKNRHLANYLLPIFTALPGTWRAVPLLCRVNEPTLQEALSAWIQVSPPEAQPGLRQIRSLFGFPDSDPEPLLPPDLPSSN